MENKNFNFKFIDSPSYRDFKNVSDIRFLSFPQKTKRREMKRYKRDFVSEWNDTAIKKNVRLILAYSDKKLVGFLLGMLYFDQMNANINNLFVHHSYQENGIGQNLIQLYERYTSEQNFKKVTVTPLHSKETFYTNRGYAQNIYTMEFEKSLSPNR